MTRLEIRSTVALVVVFAARLLGLFMIYPVFANYATHLRAATPSMSGIALGACGLTQGLLQIPCGLISDRTVRKPVIATGLPLFAAGSTPGSSGYRHHLRRTAGSGSGKTPRRR